MNKVFKTQKIVLFKTKTILKQKKRFKISTEKKNLLIPKIHEKNQNLISSQFLKKKRYHFNINKIDTVQSINGGRWNDKEQTSFLQALDKYGVNWKKISESTPSRTNNQIRSHAQKFFQKIKKYKNEELGIDLTLDSVQNIKDAIRHIKSVNSDYSIFSIFSHISELYDKKKSKLRKQEINTNNIFLEGGNNNINNVYNNFTFDNKENTIIKEKDINLQLININNNSSNTIDSLNNLDNKEVNKTINYYSINNNQGCGNIINYDYFNQLIINNVVNIMNNINKTILYNYLNNLNNYNIL